MLEGGHVAAESELLAVQTLQVLLPGRDLGADLSPVLRLGHDGQLQFSHMLQLVVLDIKKTNKTQIPPHKNN